MNVPPMRFREVSPPENLALSVDCFWEFIAGPDVDPGHVHRIPVDGCTSISCHIGIGPAIVLGPRVTSFHVPLQPDTVYAGVRLQPWASGQVLGIHGCGLRDYAGPLDVLKSGLSAQFQDALTPYSNISEHAGGLAKVIRSWTLDNPRHDDAVMAGVGAIRVSAGTAKVSAVAAISALSERQFQRRFRKEVGLTPKQYARIVRIRSAMIDFVKHGADNWGYVAARHGFSDQAHLIREFADIFGMTPTEFETVFAPAIEHTDVR